MQAPASPPNENAPAAQKHAVELAQALEELRDAYVLVSMALSDYQFAMESKKHTGLQQQVTRVLDKAKSQY